ncbi:MAG: gliding motility-associated C-terminal domain-containing protein, partial [Bacteroidota bacterium]|nr:gliding motility-associated C-terminal domain-containing protein [Bacteroidota bacterium]
DDFYVTTKGIASLSCVIYDRWGLKIAEWNGVNGSWNGETFNGGNAPDGTYFFILHATALNGRQTEKQGYIQLVNGK